MSEPIHIANVVRTRKPPIRPELLDWCREYRSARLTMAPLPPTQIETMNMKKNQGKSTKRKRADGKRAVLRRASPGQGLSVGDRVMDTLIHQSATVTKVIPSAIMPSWIVAYLITYDVPPPMEYNMGSVDCMQFSKWIRPL